MAGPSQRIAVAAHRRRQYSLRVVMWVGVAVGVLFGVATAVVVNRRLVHLSDARAEARTRHTIAVEENQRRLVSLLDQDRGLAAYLASGEPAALALFDQGRADELAAIRAFDQSFDAPAPPELTTRIATLDAAITTWRDDAWATARQQRAQAGWVTADALLVVAATMADVRTAHTAVTDALHLEELRIVDRYRSAFAATLTLGAALASLVGVLAVVMVVWILRRTATPLEDLSRIAASGAVFPAPTGPVGIHEVDTLAWALHELDLTVRDREQRLADAHAAAVELGRFGEHVQQVVEEDELHQALAARLAAVSGADSLHTLIRNPSLSRLDVALSTDDLPDRVQLPILAEPMKCRAIRTLRPVTDDGNSATACRCDLAPAGGSYLCEPMLAAGELIGVINLTSTEPGHFADQIQHQVHASLGFGATALASIRLLATTRDRALRDPLTGAYNRAFLTEHLNQHLALAARRSERLGVLALDLDHFKKLNDTYGHAIGDRALIASVEAINGQVRSSDAVVRHGGEELVVVLVDTGLDGAMIAAERIRKAIEAIALPTDKGTVGVRVSIGVAAYPEHGRNQPSLLAAADRALYEAKAAGRNQVIAATSPDAGTDPVATSAVSSN